ncbi:efflux transporter outer membrane subunit [Pseudoduganella umbonata]|uniref:Efflux transporter outer membrane subunit n=1 Tax=Pseudoduganella umbonata TaxID=864828 RepID=A0A4P8HQA1_9BURK|nr:efflux transporter outer membrane subunit [Pseudoduganella umbonata]MBB3220539.1 multidrug efflux system outer membrane protein [Pseudoduganella umbonata]QCP11949.1 efflux transporter outer membrane subunit [Pseudoduganella umbonata]
MNKLIARGRTPALSLIAALVLTACAAPEFRQPAVEVPAAFKETAGDVKVAADGTRWKEGQPAEQQPRGEWWLAFNDPALDELMAEAIRSNANLTVAAARVKQARAIAGIAEADRIPQVGVGVGAGRSQQSPQEAGLPQGTRMAPGTSYNARLTASYEVDLFGRVSSNVAAARNDAATVEANYRSVLLSLQADVAQTWFRLRATDAELATVAQTVRLREENVKVNQRRFDLGDIGEFDLSRAKTELATARAEAIGLQRQRTNAEHALAVLLGKPAASFGANENPLAEDDALPVIPAGLPSSLLERRPDIAAAQRAMEASNARIGVARSAMFPALTISADGGGVGPAFSDVFRWSSRSWLLGALLSMPVIDGGRNRANITRSEAVLEESVGTYRQAVLSAFAEVEDNLAGLRILSGQAAQIDDAVVSARRSADLAQRLYDAGRSSYLELLDAQRNLATVERTAVQLRGDRAVTTVALIRALGGGWDPVASTERSASVAGGGEAARLVGQ